jgi:phospholipase D1/2
MQMMYDIVAKELKVMQLVDSHPQDYLNFYCLGNREDFSEESLSDNADKVIVLMKISFVLLETIMT